MPFLLDTETNTLHVPPCEYLSPGHQTREVASLADAIHIETRATSERSPHLRSNYFLKDCPHCIHRAVKPVACTWPDCPKVGALVNGALPSGWQFTAVPTEHGQHVVKNIFCPQHAKEWADWFEPIYGFRPW